MKAGFPGRMTPATGFVFRPTQISGNVLWLDAADLGTITSSVGKVSQWNDKSGQGNNVTQGTGSAQPTTDATLQSGKNVLDFDGGDTFIAPSGLFSVPSGNSTLFVVAATTTTGTQRMMHMAEGGSSRYFIQYESTGTVSYQSKISAGGQLSKGSVTISDWNVLRGRRSGNTQAISVNNGAETTDANGASESGVDSAFVGSREDTDSFLTGSIAEIIIYDRSLSAAEMNQVETYLANKWGTG